ncbi:hypothetical protein CHARACLAT_027101, partial [Characodon lateralis]|nr:hypothetical protein [Characodon lateralis]
SHMRKVNSTKRGKASSLQTATQQDLDSHLTLLSLIEDDISERAEGDSSERGEPEIEDYESDKDNDYTLVKTTNVHQCYCKQVRGIDFKELPSDLLLHKCHADSVSNA